MKSTFDWLENEAYLPGYMTLVDADQSNKTGYFNFRLVEPPVLKVGLNYLTPRGNHICISQASYWLMEQLTELGKLSLLNVKDLRTIGLDGRLKIVELNQKLRKEIKLDEIIKGKFELTNLRLGKMLLIKMDFDLGERGVIGNLTAVLAPKPVPQLNQDILRK